MTENRRALLNVGIYKASHMTDEAAGLMPNGADGDELLRAYYDRIEEVTSEEHGDVCQSGQSGQQDTVCLFPTIPEALSTAKKLLRDMTWLNREKRPALSGAVVFTRIGIDLLQKADQKEPGEADKRRAAKLQTMCPLGRIAISAEVYAQLGIEQPLFRPSLLSYARNRPVFVLANRMIAPQELDLLHGLDDRQRSSIAPIPFLSWERVCPNASLSFASMAGLLAEPLVVIVGETSHDRTRPLTSAATSDAIGIMEVLAALKSNGDVIAAVDLWSDTADLVSDRHVVLIGSGIVNAYAFAINDIMEPLHFLKKDGMVFTQIVATAKGEESQQFGLHAIEPPDVGMVLVTRSPFNPDKMLVWIAGINGMATQAAALLMKDLVVDPGACARKMGIPRFEDAIGCVVAASPGPDVSDLRLADYYRKWRIRHYSGVWAINSAGDRLQ